ncbi:MAG TPA: glycosyltransferase family 39 protein [Bryobacteraceae bacterium]|jgi:hypothetical protein
MRIDFRSAFVFLILLIPSAQFAWRNRDMPEFAYLHDDGVLYISGKTLAAGEGFRIASLPEDPSQTKFPPLYPLYLSLIWRLDPRFPQNLLLATLFSWITLAACLALAWRLYRSDGFSEKRTWLVAALLAVNPYMILFGCSMFSEMFFTCCVLATFLAARRSVSEGATGMMVLAGLAAGAAYLSRTAGIALLISVPAWLIWKKELRRAAVFAATMLPAVAGWSLWMRAHLPHTADQTLLYYTDYYGFWMANIRQENLAVLLWKNADQMLYSMGSLVLPKVFEALPVKILTQVIAVAMIAGVVRLLRRRIAVDYALFALISAGILMIWHYPPTERFLLPLFPLLIAGLITELEHLASMFKAAFRKKALSERVVAAGFSTAVVGLFAAALFLEFYVSFGFLQASADQKRAKLSDLRTAYAWMSENLPPSATILSYDDPLLYLYTGHRGNYMPLLSRWWYSEDHTSIVNAYRQLAEYCRDRGLDYVYFTSQDVEREVDDDDKHAIQRVVEKNPELLPVFQAGIGTVYKVARP